MSEAIFSDPICINEITHSFLILSMRHCCTCFNLYTEFQICNFYVNLQISTSLDEEGLQPSPPRFRVSASLGREQTRAIRSTVGRKAVQAFTSCVTTMMWALWGWKWKEANGGRQNGKPDRSSSVLLCRKNKSYGSSSQIKEDTLLLLFEESVWGSCKKADENSCVRMLNLQIQGKFGVNYWLIYPKGLLPTYHWLQAKKRDGHVFHLGVSWVSLSTVWGNCTPVCFSKL